MNLTLSIVLVSCLVIITLTNIFLALTVGLILIRVRNIMIQFEKFIRILSKFTIGSSKIWGAIIGSILGLIPKKK